MSLYSPLIDPCTLLVPLRTVHVSTRTHFRVSILSYILSILERSSRKLISIPVPSLITLRSECLYLSSVLNHLFRTLVQSPRTYKLQSRPNVYSSSLNQTRHKLPFELSTFSWSYNSLKPHSVHSPFLLRIPWPYFSERSFTFISTTTSNSHYSFSKLC